MHAAHSSDAALSYSPYVSDPDKYKQHFSSSSFYNPNSFCLVGEVDSLPTVGDNLGRQVGGGSGGEAPAPLVKLVSPTEGAVERAKEELKRERKQKRVSRSLHLLGGGGRGNTSSSKKNNKKKKKSTHKPATKAKGKGTSKKTASTQKKKKSATSAKGKGKKSKSNARGLSKKK